jgi:hypothetical protein
MPDSFIKNKSAAPASAPERCSTEQDQYGQEERRERLKDVSVLMV